MEKPRYLEHVYRPRSLSTDSQSPSTTSSSRSLQLPISQFFSGVRKRKGESESEEKNEERSEDDERCDSDNNSTPPSPSSLSRSHSNNVGPDQPSRYLSNVEQQRIRNRMRMKKRDKEREREEEEKNERERKQREKDQVVAGLEGFEGISPSSVPGPSLEDFLASDNSFVWSYEDEPRVTCEHCAATVSILDKTYHDAVECKVVIEKEERRRRDSPVIRVDKRGSDSRRTSKPSSASLSSLSSPSLSYLPSLSLTSSSPSSSLTSSPVVRRERQRSEQR